LAPSGSFAIVLFAKIVGSNEKAAALGDRRRRDLLGNHHGLVRRNLDQFRGREVKTTGDGFLAAFDGPARSVRCAWTIAEEARPLGIEIRAGLDGRSLRRHRRPYSALVWPLWPRRLWFSVSRIWKSTA
jgi:class 3 adenylate cyclase